MRRVHPIETESYRILRGMVDLSQPGPSLAPSRNESSMPRRTRTTQRASSSRRRQPGSGISALRHGVPVVTDVGMVAAGITSRQTLCLVSDPRAQALSEQLGITRSAAGFRLAAEEVGKGAVWVVGNAPTALFELLGLDVAPRS